MCRKIVSLMLAGGLILSSGMTVVAAEDAKSAISVYEAIETMPAEELVPYLCGLPAADNREDIISCQYYADCWNDLKERNMVYMDLEGHLALEGMVADQYAELAEVMEIWNYAIDLGLLTVDYETMFLCAPEITDDVLDNASSNIMALNDNVVPYASTHGCGNNEWDVEATAAENYKTISNYYNAMQILWAAQGNILIARDYAIVYWVNYVREGGAWDYKSNANYHNETFCCKYGGKSNQDHHVSWIGNYNYGYTGKVLFDLSMLHFGSSAVAGFDPKDKIEDWPAIDEGYYDAP